MGHPVAHHVIIIHHGDQFMVSSVGKRNAQEGTKTRYTVVILLSHVLGTGSVLGMARLQHGFGSISFTLAGEKVPSRAGFVPARFIKASWASTAWLGLARFGHVYTATANRAEPCWYRAGSVSCGSVNAALVIQLAHAQFGCVPD